jgi:hypothetical protein
MNQAQSKAIAKATLDYLVNLKGIDKWWSKLPPTARTQIRRGLARAVLESVYCGCEHSFWHGVILHQSMCTRCGKPLEVHQHA